MNKPKITNGEWYHTSDGVFSKSNGGIPVAEWTNKDDGQAISAVPDMIDALIWAHDCMSNQDGYKGSDCEVAVLEALKKAGCE